MISSALLAGAVAVAGLAPTVANSNDPGVVRTDGGEVRGVVGPAVRTFQNIPYAAPPTGPRRWRAPEPAPAWNDVRDATKPGPACAQNAHPIGVPSTSEDCLSLNVTTPRDSAGTHRPVLVWIHGGSFEAGAGHQYDAGRLAARGDAVVVTVNYRLGAFGFLAHPALDDGRRLSGNFGLQDQQAALRWVRRNATAFGGNPGNVTLIGESAGGYSVCDHLASPTARGLFHRAIIHSAPCTNRWAPEEYAAPRPRQVAERSGLDLATKLGCDDNPATAAEAAECLRNVGVAEVLAATEDSHYGPVLGGDPLPRHPADALVAGTANRVPVLHGSNHDEEDGRIGAAEAATGKPLGRVSFEWQLRARYGPAADAVLRRYDPSRFASYAEALATLSTDDNWARPALETHRLLAAHLPSYAFEFAGRAPWYAGLGAPSFSPGTHHMSELAYLFDLPFFTPLDRAQRTLADRVIAHWTAFARTGDPNLPGSRSWRPAGYVRSLTPAGDGGTAFGADHRYHFWAGLDR